MASAVVHTYVCTSADFHWFAAARLQQKTPLLTTQVHHLADVEDQLRAVDSDEQSRLLAGIGHLSTVLSYSVCAPHR